MDYLQDKKGTPEDEYSTPPFLEDDEDEDVEGDAEEGCSCGYVCMDCLGMSDRDFM